MHDFVILEYNDYIGGRVAHTTFGAKQDGLSYTVELGANCECEDDHSPVPMAYWGCGEAEYKPDQSQALARFLNIVLYLLTVCDPSYRGTRVRRVSVEGFGDVAARGRLYAFGGGCCIRSDCVATQTSISWRPREPNLAFGTESFPSANFGGLIMLMSQRSGSKIQPDEHVSFLIR